jgi:hypothetical protein
MIKATAKDKREWVSWLYNYGAEKLFDSLIANIQNVKSTCINCGEDIFCDIVEGGGVPDWGTNIGSTMGLDYGCIASPDTNDQGTGGHEPARG